MERSSSTIPETHIFFVPNIKGLAQTVLTWEGKVFAAADADANANADADSAETDWKHKVTPERGDLIRTHDSMVNTCIMSADNLLPQGAKVSTATVLAQFSKNTLPLLHTD